MKSQKCEMKKEELINKLFKAFEREHETYYDYKHIEYDELKRERELVNELLELEPDFHIAFECEVEQHVYVSQRTKRVIILDTDASEMHMFEFKTNSQLEMFTDLVSTFANSLYAQSQMLTENELLCIYDLSARAKFYEVRDALIETSIRLLEIAKKYHYANQETELDSIIKKLRTMFFDC